VVLLAALLACIAIMPHDSSAATPSAALKPLSLIVACTSEGGIGNGGELPWRIPGDMAYFKRITTDQEPAGAGGRLNAVVMGRKTWESIPAKFRPLPNRVNVVLSRNPAALDLPAGVLRAASIEDALAAVDNRADIDQCFVIGGAEVYKQALGLERLCKVSECSNWWRASRPAPSASCLLCLWAGNVRGWDAAP
jgi:dihydrofolate reductase